MTVGPPLVHIAERTGRSLNGSERNPLYGKIETLRDVVMFFHHQPRATAQTRHSRPMASASQGSPGADPQGS